MLAFQYPSDLKKTTVVVESLSTNTTNVLLQRIPAYFNFFYFILFYFLFTFTLFMNEFINFILPHLCTYVIVLGIVTPICTYAMVLGLLFVYFQLWNGLQCPIQKMWQVVLPNVSIQCSIVHSDVYGLLLKTSSGINTCTRKEQHQLLTSSSMPIIITT